MEERSRDPASDWFSKILTEAIERVVYSARHMTIREVYGACKRRLKRVKVVQDKYVVMKMQIANKIKTEEEDVL